MKPLFEVTTTDVAFYESNLRDFLPERILDCHTHVWLDSMLSADALAVSRTPGWAWRAAKDDPVEDLMATYRLLLPGKEVTPLMFSHVIDRDNLDALNSYVAECAAAYGFPSLAVTLPEWHAERFEKAITEGAFLGAKPYPTFSPGHIPVDDICIFDFLPHHQLEIMNRKGWICLLHLPRRARLRDPLNLAQLLEIEDRYPNVRLIVAHIGRAYCFENIGNAFQVLGDAEKMVFEISANTNARVMKRLIDAVGPQRIIFGSDLPTARTRLRRIYEGENYVNLVPGGCYGDLSDDRNCREVEGEEAEELTFFMYEVMHAFRLASLTSKLTRSDIEDVFCNNALRIIESVQCERENV